MSENQDTTLIALVPTAYIDADGKRQIVQPGEPLPGTLSAHDRRELLAARAARDPAADKAQAQQEAAEKERSNAAFQAERDKAQAARASTATPAKPAPAQAAPDAGAAPAQAPARKKG